MATTSKVVMISLSIMMMLFSTTLSVVLEFDENHIKSTTFFSEKVEVGPGKIAVKTLFDIHFPKGHIGIKSFDVEVVDEDGNFVPLYEAYLHHWFAVKYIENITMSEYIKQSHDIRNGIEYERNDGACQGFLLPHYWGLGGESQGTSSNLPGPFAVEVGNPTKIKHGFTEKWLFSIMLIDTRGTHDRKGCTECRCKLMNLPKDFYNVTTNINGQLLSKNYKGGLFCCQDNLQCKLRNGFKGPTRKLSLKYKIRWVDWDEHQVPLKFYILDSADRVISNGSTPIHDCQVEYKIPRNHDNDFPHVKKANIPITKGGYLIHGTAHMHTGVVNITLYGQDGRVLCTSNPKYGIGKEAGNENGYLVGMSVCNPKPGSIIIKDGEILTVESIYENKFRTGAMGISTFTWQNIYQKKIWKFDVKLFSYLL
ncbi:Stress up-regulated Nod 19 [Vigna unguiculata]|uniref:Stress up-regulated Nod 19 n=1 Tax=Vigna unguiculata TaxID=3917 RepID=A0A4D6MT89_VIGUN|nr:Stress up-regulated Nod 19 [Vigna unguiculata]